MEIKKKLSQILEGIEDTEVVDVIKDYGYENYPKLVQDYESNLVFAHKVGVLTLTNSRAKELLELYPNGYGFRVQKSKTLDDFGVFLSNVVSKEISEEGKLVKDLDPLMEENRDAFEKERYAKNLLLKAKEVIKLECEASGNGLKEKFKTSHKKFIRILGHEDGKVEVFISDFAISDQNTGNKVFETNNACEIPFEKFGRVRGLFGTLMEINDKEFLFFEVDEDDNDLFIWSSRFSNGKEYFNEKEFGTLVK